MEPGQSIFSVLEEGSLSEDEEVHVPTGPQVTLTVHDVMGKSARARGRMAAKFHVIGGLPQQQLQLASVANLMVQLGVRKLSANLQWASVSACPAVHMLLLIPGISYEAMGTDAESHLPFLRQLWRAPVRGPGSHDGAHDPMPVLFHRQQRPRPKDDQSTGSGASFVTRVTKLSPVDLLMSRKQLRSQGFPSVDPDDQLEGYEHVPAQSTSGPAVPLLGIDCEMCETAKGPKLTRVAVVDEDGKVILDQLVKPELRITDYLTRYSGITEEMLKGVTTTVEEARDMVAKLIAARPGVVLVGHSLENDMHALQLSYSRIIDTSVIYPREVVDGVVNLRAKHSLRFLTTRYLHRRIQQHTDDRDGHCPAEDAQAALDLVKLKLLRGRGHGMPDSSFLDTQESLFQALTRRNDEATIDVVGSQVFVDNLVLPAQSSDLEHVQGYPTANDEDTVAAVAAAVEGEEPKLVVAELRQVAEVLADPATFPTTFLPPSEDATRAPFLSDKGEELVDALRASDRAARDIYESLPPNSIMVVTTMRGHDAYLKYCAGVKEEMEAGHSWSVTHAERLKALANTCRESALMLAVTRR